MPSKNSVRWQPGKVRDDLPVDRPVDRPTVIFMTVVPSVDCPVDRAWKQRATALFWSTVRLIGTRYREQQLSAGRLASRPGPFPES